MLTIVLSVISNGLVLFILRRQKELHDNMRVLYQILATSDLILSISWSSWNMIWFSFKNEQTCTIISLVFPFFYMVSIWFVMLALFAISFNLYLMITKPLRYPMIVTRTRLLVTLGSAGATTMLVCAVYLPIPESPFIRLLMQHCRMRDVRPTAEWPSVVFMFHLLTPILATMLFTTVIYIRLLLIACQKKKTVAHHQAPVFGRIEHVDAETPNVVKQQTGRPQRGHGPDAMRNPNRQPTRGAKWLTTVLLLIGSFYIVWISFIAFFLTIMEPSRSRHPW